MSHQMEMTVTSQNQQWTESLCRKCGRKNQSTTWYCKKVTCKQCKGKDHTTKYCTTSSQSEPKCTYCRKGKHTTEECKVRKKAEKKLEKESRASRTPLVTSTTTSTMLLRALTLLQAQAPQIPLQWYNQQCSKCQYKQLELKNSYRDWPMESTHQPHQRCCHLHQHSCIYICASVKMEIEPILLQDQLTWCRLQHQVCMGKITIRDQMHLMEHHLQLQMHP